MAYIATVRITHRRSGVYREDCGSGDAIDKSLGNACGNALKGAITDALKRAARHFGEKLGNSLYHDGFNVNKAPGTLKDALETLDIERAKSRFGFDKNRAVASQNASVAQSNVAKQATANRVINKPEIKAEPAQNKASNGYASTTSNMPNQSKVNPIGSTSATTNKYAGSNSAPPHTNAPSQYPNLITPAQKVGVNMTLNSANPADSNGRTNNVQRNSAPFPFSDYVATPAEINGNNAATLTSVEKAQSMTKGLDLPPRPNTSRGVTAVPIAGGGISFYGAVCAGNPNQPFYEQQGEPNTVHALKRKADQTQMSSEAPPTKAVGTGVRNPYNC